MISGPQIQVFSGAYFQFEKPEQYFTEHSLDVIITDLAHALGNLCRYTGHCREFYSVAQHSALVASILPPKLKLEGLLHDGQEAFVNDLSRPLKRMPELAKYTELENNIQRAMYERFGLEYPTSEPVHHADLVLLATERRDLLHPNGKWAILEGINPLPDAIRGWGPRLAKSTFISQYNKITGKV
jgi:hypothetical protein